MKKLACFLAVMGTLFLSACAIDSQGFYVQKGASAESAAEVTGQGIIREPGSAAELKDCKTFQEILDKRFMLGSGFAETKLGGSEVLLLSDGLFQNADGKGAAVNTEVYGYKNGTASCLGYVKSGGTATPLAVKDGFLYAAGHHYIGKITVKDGELITEEEAWQTFDKLGNAAYHYSSGSDGKSLNISPAEAEASFDRLYSEYMEGEVLEFEIVEMPSITPKAGDAEIIEAVVDNFLLMAQVPRPSHHEEKIGEFLMKWAREQGFDPVQDKTGNIMFDIPATEGMEDLPLCILQGHMDMVVAVADGKAFDPLRDPITVIRNEADNTLSADGTSLGGDDGIGCAMIMAAAQGKMDHGPLRALITVDEEDGMDGAFNLDASWLEGASFLINIDNEASDEVLVSTAAGDSIRSTADMQFRKPAGDLAVTVTLSGLRGGHSGVEIDKGRLNALIGLAGFLKELDREGIDCELASFEGGTASNAIPAKASCCIVLNAADRDALTHAADVYFGDLEAAYAGIEDGLAYSLKEEQSLPLTVSKVQKQNVIRYMTEIIDGVYTWSADKEGLVESSSNLGLFSLDQGGLTAVTYIRSSSGPLQQEILEAQKKLAAECGFDTEHVRMADPWPYDPDSRLLALTQEIYREQNGEDISVVAVHAGLECGTFKTLNPDLDMISIGPDLWDAHTIHETLYLDSVPKVWRLMEGLLARIG